MRLLAVLVTTNECRWLPDALGTLVKSRLNSDILLEVMMIDNASIDGSSDYVDQNFPQVLIHRSSKNLGFAEANNLGMQHAIDLEMDFVFLVNPDTRTPPDLIQEMIDFLIKWPGYGVVGPLQNEYNLGSLSSDSLNQWSRDVLRIGEGHVFSDDGVSHKPLVSPLAGRAPDAMEHAYVQGSAFMCRVDVLHEVGNFDSIYHTYYEETDLCRRVRWAGWRVAILTTLRIEHAGGGSDASLYRQIHMQRNKYYFLLTDPEWGFVESLGLAWQWIRGDLVGRNAVPADGLFNNILNTVRGLTWILLRIPRIIMKRKSYKKFRHIQRGQWRSNLQGPKL